jgi:hypothetical protein
MIVKRAKAVCGLTYKGQSALDFGKGIPGAWDWVRLGRNSRRARSLLQSDRRKEKHPACGTLSTDREGGGSDDARSCGRNGPYLLGPTAKEETAA